MRVISIVVNIVDAIMGVGKTTSAINYINKSNPDVKFLYITPYLSEVERIIKNCPLKNFKEPKSYGTKLNGIKLLFKKGENIVSTHSLFSLFDEEIIDLAYNNNYVLIMDEVANVIEPFEITKDDLKTILDKYVHIENGHTLVWDAKDYKGEFEEHKRLCELGCLGIYNNQIVLWLFPISTFRAFRNIYILTYMFQAQTQKYYYDFYGVDYHYLYVKRNEFNEYEFTDNTTNYKSLDYTKLIHICDNDKINEIGDLDTALSKTWYIRNENNGLLKKLKNNCINYFKNYSKTLSNQNLWTTFKTYKSKISGKGYSKGFLSSNMRATNEYRDRIAVAYLVNKYFNPYIKNFFVANGVKVDEDAYAVSEMLQFIWRSAIREGNPIELYIPSKRMRILLIQWMNSLNKEDK